jgi:hypothetical protein
MIVDSLPQDVNEKVLEIKDSIQIDEEQTGKMEEEENQQFDLYDHLKVNIKEFEKNCKDKPKESFSFYCLPCKTSICNECNYESHKTHYLVKKINYSLEKDTFSKIFEEAESEILSNELMTSSSFLKEKLKQIVIEQIDKMHQKLEEIKQKKLIEIENLFNIISSVDSELVFKNLEEVKTNINQFYEINEKFFNMNHNEDQQNTVFLMNYEIVNKCQQKNKEMVENLKKSKEAYENYNDSLLTKIENINKTLELLNLNEDMGEYNTGFLSIEKLNSKLFDDVKFRTSKFNEHINNFKNLVYDSFKKTGNMKEIEDMVNLYDEKNDRGIEIKFNSENEKNNNNNSNNNKLQTPPTKRGQHQSSKLNKAKLNSGALMKEFQINPNLQKKTNELNSRSKGSSSVSPRKNIRKESSNQNQAKDNTNNLTNQNSSKNNKNTQKNKNASPNNFGKTVFPYSSNKHSRKISNDTNTLKNLCLETSPDVKDTEYINFYTEQNGVSSNGLIEDNIPKNLINSNLENMPPSVYGSKDDILLDSRTISRYFSYATLDAVNRYFRLKTTSGGLTSFNNFTLTQPQLQYDDEDADVCKPLTGTNEIQIYDRKKRQITKRKVPLEKAVHGYSVFLDGNRSVIANDKLFITGGRDTVQEYAVVLCYDFKEHSIKRISDMINAHSYHTLEFSESFKTLLIIGGENNKSCEVFDLFTQSWRSLPDLNFPRANATVYFDNLGSKIYALFGLNGDITVSNYSDVIEVVELQDLQKGWMKIDYLNKSTMHFKLKYCSVYPLTKDKLLIYGANSLRNSLKSFAVFDLVKKEIFKVDSKMMELIISQARKSKRLSKILFSINIGNK